MSPLMFAVKENRSSLIDRLIDLGCDVSARNFVSTLNLRFSSILIVGRNILLC